MRDLVELPDSAPPLVFRWRQASSVSDHYEVAERRVYMGAKGDSRFQVDRDPLTVTFDLPARPEPDALLHPLATVPISVVARWRGDITLHGGAFATPEGAFAVAGDREAGKSTTLALLCRRGLPVVADDLLVVAEGQVWSGPSCVDLRPDAAARFAEARDLGVVGQRPRHRLSSPPAPSRAPLRGFFLLGWHDAPDVLVEPLTLAERLDWLYRLEYIALMGPTEPGRVMELLELPAWRVVRPRDWDAGDRAVEEMVATAAAQA